MVEWRPGRAACEWHSDRKCSPDQGRRLPLSPVERESATITISPADLVVTPVVHGGSEATEKVPKPTCEDAQKTDN